MTFQSWDTTSISLSAGCDLFMRYVTRTSALEYEDFDAAKLRLIERGEKFGEISLKVSNMPWITLYFFVLLAEIYFDTSDLYVRHGEPLQCLVKTLYLMVVQS